MNINKNIGYLLMMILASPSIVFAQDNQSNPNLIAVDGFSQEVTLQKFNEAHPIEDGLDLSRKSIITDQQDLTVAIKVGDKLKIKAVKKQLAKDWHDYKVQRSKLEKLIGVDYQHTDFSSDPSRHHSSADVPPPAVTLQELRDIHIIKGKLLLIKQAMTTDRQTYDDVTKAGDMLKLQTVQKALAQDFSEYKTQMSMLKALEAQINPGRNRHKQNK